MRLDSWTQGAGGPYAPRLLGSVLADANWSGASFNDGLIRFHDSDSGPEYAELVRMAFSDSLSADADVVAFDWSGRQFVVDAPRRRFGRRADPLIFGADPAAGTIEEVASLSEFLAFLQLDDPGSAMQEATYREFLRATGHAPVHFGESVGLTIPLFLGGTDDVPNMEVVDNSVYWTVNAQVIAQMRTRPAGTPVRFEVD